jgi:uncharacterized membrane protein YgdD (TMEM256/DUF423 family)
MNNRQASIAAGFVGFTGVFFGAFGAHILRDMLARLGTTEFWHTAVLYQLVHAVVLLVLSSWRPVPRFAYYAILVGVILFSGSLYALALTNMKWVGLITPLGGFGMLFGWLAVVFRKSQSDDRS